MPPGRPNKFTVDYFPHVTSHNKTIPLLKKMFGNAGYAVFFQLLEILGKTDGHYFDFSDELDWLHLCSEVGEEENLVKEILDLLARVNAIDRKLYENRIIWSDNFVKNLERVYQKRHTEIPLKPPINAENPISRHDNSIVGTEIRQSKVEKSKVEKSKAKKASIEKEKIKDGSSVLIDELIGEATKELYESKRFPKVNAFVNAMVKQGKNKRAILHCLNRCLQEEVESPWAYCIKIMSVENGNYNEQEFSRHN